MQEVQLYTDGACSGNPGPGGFGTVLLYGTRRRELSAGFARTTNNRMELMAAIQGLEALKRPGRVTLTTDSTYVKDGITKWIFNWKKNGWRSAVKKPIKNMDLWQRLDAAVVGHDVNWRWVKGHAGHAENERVDNLARAAAEKIRDRG